MSRLIELTGGKVPQRAIRHLSSLPYAASIQWEAVDWGTPTTNITFNAPSARRGKVLALDVTGVTETFTSVTTDPSTSVGIDGGDVDAYCTADFGDADLVAAEAINFNAADGSLVNGVDEIIPGGGIVTITPVAATGGTPAGIADLTITVLYFE